MAARPSYPISDRPAMPKKVWYTSAMSSGRSLMPPSSSSCAHSTHAGGLFSFMVYNTNYNMVCNKYNYNY
jgi:hypothetical protein